MGSLLITIMRKEGTCSDRYRSFWPPNRGINPALTDGLAPLQESAGTHNRPPHLPYSAARARQKNESKTVRCAKNCWAPKVCANAPGHCRINTACQDSSRKHRCVPMSYTSSTLLKCYSTVMQFPGCVRVRFANYTDTQVWGLYLECCRQTGKQNAYTANMQAIIKHTNKQ